MSRRDNAEQRCKRCRIHASVCVCALIPSLPTRTRLALFIHRFEDRKPTNTGRLATECLPNSEVFVRGHVGAVEAPFEAPAEYDPVLLFPHEDARPLADFAGAARPIMLLVPDGTWRQASKVRNRVPGVRDLPCASLPPGPPSLYRLRSEAHGFGLATMEAIARAMGILEGREVKTALEYLFRVMVERALWSRGGVHAKNVTGGIPEGAVRHDPRSGLARSPANP